MNYDTPPYYISAYSLACKRGFVGSVDDWLKSLKGDKGDTGKSAYQYAVEAGYQGTEEQFSERQGQTGKSAYEFAVEGGYQGTRAEFSQKLAQERLEVFVGSTKPEHKPVIWVNNAGQDAVISEEYLKTESVLLYIDGNGNKYAVYPVTKMDLVEGLEQELRTMKTQCDDKLPKAGGTMTGEIAMGGSKITGLAAPSAPADAVTKAYADAKRFTASATLGTGWSASAPYSQTVPVPGLLETDIPHVVPVYDSDPAAALSQRESWAMVCQADAGTDSLTFTCFEDCPGAAVPLQIEVMR